MSDPHYCQYAFTQPECRVQEIGPGVDPHYNVELIRDGAIAAVVSRVSLERFSPERLQGKTAEDIRWLGEVATRYNRIVCQAADGAAVLPLRLGTLFRSLESLRAAMQRCRSTVAEFLGQCGDRREWGVKLYLAKGKRGQSPFVQSTLRAVPANGDCPLFPKQRMETMPAHARLQPPHFRGGDQRIGCGAGVPPAACSRDGCTTIPAAVPGQPLDRPQSGTEYLSRKKALLNGLRELRAAAQRSTHAVEQRLLSIADNCCRIRKLSGELTGRSEEMVFNAAYLLPSAVKDKWLSELDDVAQDVRDKGLLLEVSGPWPPYHFCPQLEL